ncbi:MAG: STAS domain-containing protein [Lentisphaeria bacterium]|nr:STAS domain-containing protein [Lentisphaeria bacterium]MBQ7396572.1 STAS domain-containing protein [Lentisphaeria bacterium]MBR7119413.1 STAS domain-containing protein [Lentisphaeria bacterium]
MEMRFEYIDGVLVAHVQMFLDNAGAENFKYVLNERMKEGEKVILDLEKLINIDSYGLDALLAMAQKALENNSVIKLARVSADMQIVLDITKVYRVFDIYPTIEEAVASCQETKA